MTRRPWQETALYLYARGGMNVTEIAKHPDVNKSRQSVSSFLNDPDVREEIETYSDARAQEYRQKLTEVDNARHEAEELAWQHVLEVLRSQPGDRLFPDKTRVSMEVLKPVLDADQDAQAPVRIEIEYV